MGLGAFVCGFEGSEILQRLTSEGLGIFLVGDGVFRAVMKEDKKPAIFDNKATFYALVEDVRSRGFSESEVHPKVRLINYREMADLIMNDYEKLAWF